MSAPEGEDGKHDDATRGHQLNNANKLAVFTVIWNTIESILAVIFAVSSNSVSLMAYGIDGIIETASAVVMLWRIKAEKSEGKKGAAKQEKRACTIIGGLLLLLAVYISVDSITTLAGMQEKAEASWPGVILTALAILVTPFVVHKKLKCSHKLQSGAQRADAMQTLASCWLSITAMLGLTATAVFGWSWADPLAALLFLPVILKEGIDAIRCK